MHPAHLGTEPGIHRESRGGGGCPTHNATRPSHQAHSRGEKRQLCKISRFIPRNGRAQSQFLQLGTGKVHGWHGCSWMEGDPPTSVAFDESLAQAKNYPIRGSNAAPLVYRANAPTHFVTAFGPMDSRGSNKSQEASNGLQWDLLGDPYRFDTIQSTLHL